jgi:hypothetical protein
MEQEGAFSMLPSQNRLVQVFPPTPAQRDEAEEWMGRIFGNDGVITTEHAAV